MAGVVRDPRRVFPALDINPSSSMLEIIHDMAWNAMALTRFIALAASVAGAVAALALIASSAARRAREIAIQSPRDHSDSEHAVRGRAWRTGGPPRVCALAV